MDKREYLRIAESLEQSADMLERLLKLQDIQSSDIIKASYSQEKRELESKNIDASRTRLASFVSKQRSQAKMLRDYYKVIWNAKDELAMKNWSKGGEAANVRVKHIHADPNKKPWI